MALFEVGHGLKGVARKCCEGPAEADNYQQAPTGIDQDSLGSPNDKKTHDETADDVDDQRAEGKYRTKLFNRETANQITKICADDCGDGNRKEVFYDGTLPQKSGSIV